MEVWVHNEVREDILFCFRRIAEQTEYIREVSISDRTPERKEELIESARLIKRQFKDKINQYIQDGLIGTLLSKL